MKEIILSGYLIRDIVEINNIEMIVSEMRDAVITRANIAYKKLVEWQIERIVDEITLGQIKRPEGQRIIDIAAGEVKRRIFYAEKAMQPTEFNLYIGIQVLTGKIDGKPVIYLKVLSPNNIYQKQLRKIKELEPYDITSEDLEKEKSEKAKLYNDFCSAYISSEPFGCNLMNYNLLSFKIEELSFRSPSQRAADIAREKILNHLLACYACDQEIAPNKLMEYTSFAYNRIAYKDAAQMVELEKANLENILPVIDEDMILSNGIIQKKDDAPPEENESCSCEDPCECEALDRDEAENCDCNTEEKQVSEPEENSD